MGQVEVQQEVRQALATVSQIRQEVETPEFLDYWGFVTERNTPPHPVQAGCVRLTSELISDLESLDKTLQGQAEIDSVSAAAAEVEISALAVLGPLAYPDINQSGEFSDHEVSEMFNGDEYGLELYEHYEEREPQGFAQAAARMAQVYVMAQNATDLAFE